MKAANCPVPTYGTTTNEKCPSEEQEMASFFNRIRREYPDSYGAIALHIRNEGKRHGAQMRRIKVSGGFVKGASDVIIPGNPPFVMEMKSRSKTAQLSKEQIAYLETSQNAGAFACVALGAVAAYSAFEAWLNEQAT